MNSTQTEANQGNILIVDDQPENLQVLSATLAERGYKVRCVVTGQMAIRAARSAQPDLILLDIKMPDLNGYEICDRLKSDPQTSEIPVIFISALDEVLDKVRAFSIGGADYITKPLQVEEVLARVEHQLTIRKLSKQLQAQNQQLQQEIQERRKAEQAAEAASKAKSEFLANMSHELRTPLNAILGFTQLISRQSGFNDEQQEYLEIINRSGENLLELINDVLELSKIEAGIISLDATSFDLYRFLDNLESLFQIKVEQKHLQLIFYVQSDVPQYIITDAKKLRSCLINLLGNAIKFTEFGSITLRVSFQFSGAINSPNLAKERTIYFEVEDTGPGIAPEEFEGLFDAFVQTETGRKSAEGTGLGLSITRKFVQLLGGDITVESVLGEGTTFKFNIKIAEANSSEVIAKPLRRVTALEPDQREYRILVVDDMRENRLLLVKLLEPFGFGVREAENGSEGIDLWESWQPHLIWMDTRMPVMNGVEAARQIRTKERQGREIGSYFNTTSKQGSSVESSIPSPQSRRTILIALTTSVFEESQEEIRAAGFDDVVRKPVTEDIIFAKMGEYLGLRYIYENLTQSTTASWQANAIEAKPDSFFIQELSTMPRPWVASLNQAANEVNEELLLQLIEQISETNTSLAEALMNLANDFRLDIIVRLTATVLEEFTN